MQNPQGDIKNFPSDSFKDATSFHTSTCDSENVPSNDTSDIVVVRKPEDSIPKRSQSLTTSVPTPTAYEYHQKGPPALVVKPARIDDLLILSRRDCSTDLPTTSKKETNNGQWIRLEIMKRTVQELTRHVFNVQYKIMLVQHLTKPKGLILVSD